ncbi:MAG: nitroreductase family protein [Treponema sp.]|jgi:nitroreductase|nr:nitroreductase family protein [Treponema sp.]
MVKKIYSVLLFIILSCSQSKDIIKAEESKQSDGIFDRKTARTFSPDRVAQEQIELIIKAAFASPTGGNQRSCEFIVVTDRNVMLNLKKGNPYSQALDTAPLTIVVAVNTKTAIYPELLTLEAGIAAQSILAQASKLGFSSVPMSIAPQRNRIQGVSEALNIPSEVIPQVMICIGQPAIDAVSSASTNYYDKNKVHYNKY